MESQIALYAVLGIVNLDFPLRHRFQYFYLDRPNIKIRAIVIQRPRGPEIMLLVGMYAANPPVDHVLVGIYSEPQLDKEFSAFAVHVEQATILKSRISSRSVI